MKKFFVFLFYVGIVVSSCRKPDTSLTTEEKTQIQREVSKMMHDYASSIKTNGLMAEFDYLDVSADFFWVPPGYETAISYDSVANILKSNAPLLRSIENSYDSLVIFPLSKNLASYNAVITSIVTDTSGHTSTTRLIETGVVIKRESDWKLQVGQTTMLNARD